jgi:hypothetical protein
MTNWFSVVIGVVTGVVVEVVARVAVDLRLRLGKHDGGDDVKVPVLSTRDLVGGDGNLFAQLHAVLRCFTSPGVVTPSDGALQRHPHTLQTAVTTEKRTASRMQAVREDCVCSENGGCGRLL